MAPPEPPTDFIPDMSPKPTPANFLRADARASLSIMFIPELPEYSVTRTRECYQEYWAMSFTGLLTWA